jgi:Epoxide hydrolase N terminus
MMHRRSYSIAGSDDTFEPLREDEARIVRPFEIHVPSNLLSDLQQRLKNTRWSHQIKGTGWDAGTDSDYLRELLDYWQESCDWRKHEHALDQLPHFKTDIGDIGIHFIHARGRGHSRMVSRVSRLTKADLG